MRTRYNHRIDCFGAGVPAFAKRNSRLQLMSKTLYFNAETIALPYRVVNQPVIAAAQEKSTLTGCWKSLFIEAVQKCADARRALS
jgi:hypothetical protein